MTVRERVDSQGRVRYQARFRSPAGERVRTFERKGQAQQWLQAQKADASRGEWVDPLAGNVTVKAWSEQWQATIVNLRPSTQAMEESFLRTHILPRFRDQLLSRVTHMEIRAWVAQMSQTLRPETVAKVYRTFAKMLKAAVDARVLPYNPADGVPLPRIERDEMRFLTAAEVGTLAEAIGEEYRPLVLVAAYGGLRIGELAGLRRGRVDFVKGTVRVVEQATEVKGQVRFGPPKTKAANRTVALPRFVMGELERYAPLPPDALVFTAPQGGPLSRTAFRKRVWLPAVEAAGLSPLRVHDLRHTAVSLWIQAGANAKEVAVRAGHTSASLVLDRYGHLLPSSDADLAARLEALQPPKGASVTRL